MPDKPLWSVAEFNSMAEDGTPSCEQVRRLLETTHGDARDALERHLRKAAHISDDCSRPSVFLTVYNDGQSTLHRAPNGNYLVSPDPVVTSYSDGQ
jgi:hypothetical protein